MFRLIRYAMAAAVFAAPSLAFAGTEVLADNLPASTWQYGGWWTGYLDSTTQTGLVGDQFVTRDAGYIDAIQLSVWGGPAAQVLIYNQSLTSVVETLPVPVSAAFDTNAQATFASGANLAAHTVYWAVVETPGDIWENVNAPATGTMFADYNYGDSYAFVGTASHYSGPSQLGMSLSIATAGSAGGQASVPEPPAGILMALGAGLLAWIRSAAPRGRAPSGGVPACGAA